MRIPLPALLCHFVFTCISLPKQLNSCAQPPTTPQTPQPTPPPLFFSIPSKFRTLPPNLLKSQNPFMSDNEPHFAPCHVSSQPTPCRCCSDHRRRIDQLLAELDAERAAAATAAAESMEMIRRLQREKSDALLESRQFRRFAEDQIARYRFEIEALDEVLVEREETIMSLSNEVEDCKKVFDDMPQWVNDTLDDATIMEKRVVKQSPNSPNQIRHLSSSSSGSRLDFDNYEFDDITDRACIIDTVHGTSIPNYEDPMDSKSGFVVAVEEEEIRKLCERVNVLEKERESMREVMDSMEVKKEKGVILKEIKQKLYEEAAPQKKRVVKRGNFFKSALSDGSNPRFSPERNLCELGTLLVKQRKM